MSDTSRISANHIHFGLIKVQTITVIIRNSIDFAAAGRCSGGSSSAYTWLSGTSMAAPHVAGVAAMYLGEYPKALPAEVKNAIISASTQGRITSEFMRPGTPNRLLYSSVFTS